MSLTIFEQLESAAIIKAELESFHHVDQAVYTRVIGCLPPGLTSKLRLVPDSKLRSRLAHLYEVCQLATKSEMLSIEEEYELESFEGLSKEFPEDCDIIVRGMNSGCLYFVDVTANRDQAVLKTKVDTLKSLADRYSLLGSTTDYFVHSFEPYEFSCDINLISETDTPESVALRFVENVSRWSSKTSDAIIDNCLRVYESVLPDIANVDHVSHLYDKRRPTAKVIDLAKKSVSSNDVEDTVAFLAALKKKEYQPYMSSLKRLAGQYHTIKSVFRYPASRVARHKSLETALSSLDSDILCKALFKSMGSDGKVIMMRKDGTFITTDSFPASSVNQKVLSIDCGFALAVKHVRGHVFTIKFSYDEMDPNLRRIVLKEAQPKTRVDLNSESSVEKLLDVIIKSESAVNHTASEMLKSNRDPSLSTIFDKFLTMCDLVSRDLGNVGVVSTNILSKVSALMKRSLVGALISQRYEVANTFAASIKNSSKGSNYYVGVNGPFDSVTITKMNSTQDSFKTRHYCVIGRKLKIDTTSELVKKTKESKSGVFRSEFYNMNTNELVYDLKLPYIIMSLITWDIENNLKGGKLDETQLPNIITGSIMHAAVNRDVFSQASQQTRYFYASSIGYGSLPGKIADKFKFFTPRYSWEFTYIVRMVKMGASLSVLRDSDSLSSVLVENEIPVVFPHSNFPVKSFSQAVSSMYFCNVFNKFRAFHEVAASICYNDLDDENKIYESSIRQSRQSLVGFSLETEKNISDKNYLMSHSFVVNEIEFCKSLIKSEPRRFAASCAFILAASVKFLTATDSTMHNIFQDLGKSPIEACTMRGAMDHNPSGERGQSVRAASAMLERLMIEKGYDPDKVNKNPNLAQQMIDEFKEKDEDFSMLVSLIKQLTTKSDYVYRITDKDQVGTREISVLNAAFRVGALVFETVSKNLSLQVRDVNLLDDPSKEIKYEDAVKEAMASGDFSFVFFDNSDQKRWGPNHMLHFFSIMALGALRREKGLVKLLNLVAEKTLKKRAKFPEALIRYFTVKKSRGTGSKELLTNTGSAAINTFFTNHYDDLIAEIYDAPFRYGMCQGIFGGTSSAFHAILAKVQEDAMTYSYGSSVQVKTFVTSDDASRITKSTLPEMKPVMIAQHNVIVSSGNVMCVLRNDSKSAANPHVAEFNSTFYKRGQMATPSLKQRVSKLDVGSGENHYEDYLTALSNASNYFSAGGSYSGAIIMSILNLTMHTEQWNRWDFCDPKHFYKSVELGGFPVVEPFSTSICGALSNFYLRVSDDVEASDFSSMHVRNITSKPELVNLSDFNRTFYEAAAGVDSDLKIFKNSGPLGLVSLMRTDKKLSMFERRCKMSKWNIHHNFVTLTRFSASARKFIFNVSRTADMTLHDVPEGVNSFYIRYTDPWVSESRKCHRVSSNSSLIKLGFHVNETISYGVLKDKLLELSSAESKNIFKTMMEDRRENLATSVLSKQLNVRFRDAKVLLNYISNQECETFVVPKHFPSTTRLTLKETSETDRVQYTLSMVKYLAGFKARDVITEYTKNSFAFDSLPADFVGVEIPLRESIILSDNNMHVFEKYVKSYTKMVCSGRPSDLTSVVTLLLSNRFTESAGVKTVGSIRLAGDYLTTLNYTGWYRDLDARSRLAMNQNARSVMTRTYADVVKFGVISNGPTITKFDNFQITESLDNPKSVITDVKRRGEFRKAVKNWSPTNCNLILGNTTIDALHDGSLIGRNEYHIGDGVISKLVYEKYLEVEVNHRAATHQLTSIRTQTGTKFFHTILSKEKTYCAVTKCDVADKYKGEDWVTKLASQIKTIYRFKEVSHLGNDSVQIVPLGSNQVVKPTVLDKTMTLAITDTDSNLVIPVCHSTMSDVDNIDLADSITHADILTATKIYKRISDKTLEFARMLRDDEKFLKELLFKFNYYSKPYTLNRLSVKLLGSEFSVKVYDILRSLLISDSNLDVTISPSKLYNTINNSCVESDSLSSFIMSVKIGNTTLKDDNADHDGLTRLGDLMDTPEFDSWADEMADNQEPVSDVDSDGDSDEFDLSALNEIEFDLNFDELEGDEDEVDLMDILNDLNKTSRQIDDVSTVSRSLRTNHSLNPVDEFPAEVIRLTHNWLAQTSVERRTGLNYSFNSIIDVLRYYSTMVFSGQESVSDLLLNFYKNPEFKPIMPLSVISAINLC